MIYEGYTESKERFTIPRYFLIIIQTEYRSFGKYLSLLIDLVAFDIKALVVPWHQFVYTLFIPSGRRQHFLGLHHLRSVQKRDDPFPKTGKSPTVPGPDCTEDARSCHNGIAHSARLVSAAQYADVHCRVTEQFHARSCLIVKRN